MLKVFSMRALVPNVGPTLRLSTGRNGTRVEPPNPLMVLVAKRVCPVMVGSVVEDTPPIVELMGNEEAKFEMKESCQPLTTVLANQLVLCVNVGLTMPTRINLCRWSVAAVPFSSAKSLLLIVYTLLVAKRTPLEPVAPAAP